MQRLLVFQSLWAMQGLRREETLEASIREIIDAKFDGVSAVWASSASCQALGQCLQGSSLRIEGICFPKSVEDLERTFDLVAKYPVFHLNIHADVRPRTIEACAPLVEGWLRLIEQANYPVYLETHRDRLTTDLFFTLELIQRYPQLQLLADLSHYVVGRGFVYPVTDESNQAIQEILERAWSYHGRIASGEQAQLELSWPQHQHWVQQFSSWWRDGFASWQRRAPQEATLVFTCELGPQPYAIAGPDGADRSDRWAEALQLRDLARALWKQTTIA